MCCNSCSDVRCEWRTRMLKVKRKRKRRQRAKGRARGLSACAPRERVFSCHNALLLIFSNAQKRLFPSHSLSVLSSSRTHTSNIVLDYYSSRAHTVHSTCNTNWLCEGTASEALFELAHSSQHTSLPHSFQRASHSHASAI